MDWTHFTDLLVELIRPLIWAISAWIAFPSIGKLLTIWHKISHNKKEKKEFYDKISKDYPKKEEEDANEQS